jgi:hypothetical protein
LASIFRQFHFSFRAATISSLFLRAETGSWAQKEGSTNYIGLFGKHFYVPAFPELEDIKNTSFQHFKLRRTAQRVRHFKGVKSEKLILL